MSQDDRRRWDRRHADPGRDPLDATGPPSAFSSLEHLFPTAGLALDVACGPGAASVWLAQRGLEVLGVDVSPVAIGRARELAERMAVSHRCRFEVHDLEQGLPTGPAVDLILCHLFRDPGLDQAMMERLAPGGILAVAVLSEVGGKRGRFRAAPGELREAFETLAVLAEGEGDGVAWLIGQESGG